MTRRMSVLAGALAAGLAAALVVGAAFAKEDPAATRELPPVRVPPARAGVRHQRLLVLGDWGTGGRGQRRIAEAMAARVRAEAADLPADSGPAIDLVLTTGDNVYEHGVQGVDDPLWERVFERVYDQPELAVPWRPTLGNHDHRGDVAAQVAYSRRSERWDMPGRYYDFTLPLGQGQSVQLFALDTGPLAFRNPDREQLAWLDERLAASQATWKVVYGHHPLYSESVRPDNLTLIRRLEDRLVRHGVDLYLAGHDHVLELLRPIRGVHHVVTGGGAGADRPYAVRWTDRVRYAATGGGFTWLRIGPTELVIEFCRQDGRAQFAHTLVKDGAGPY